MRTSIPVFITARGNNKTAIMRNKEALKYAYIFIKDMNMFKQTWIISDNEEMLDYAHKLGFKFTFHQKCNNEQEIAYLDYIALYNFHKQTHYKPDWFLLLALSQLFRNDRLIIDCIKNIDNNYDVIASYTEISNRSDYFIENDEIVTKSHLITHERDRKHMIDAAVYAIKADFAIKCMTSFKDPSEVFWNGKIKYFQNHSLYTDIYTIEDINRFDYISDIINRVKQIKVE